MSSHGHNPHQRIESGPSNSGSSSVESLRRGAPSTPPQVQLSLDPVAVSDATGFSDFFPWMKQNEAQLSAAPSIDNLGGKEPAVTAPHGAVDLEPRRVDSIAAFQQRDATHLPKQSLQPVVSEEVQPVSSLGLFQETPPMQSAAYAPEAMSQGFLSEPLGYTRADLTIGRTSTSTADFYTAAEYGPRQSWTESRGDVLSPAELGIRSSSSLHYTAQISDTSRSGHSPMLTNSLSPPPAAAPPLPHTSTFQDPAAAPSQADQLPREATRSITAQAPTSSFNGRAEDETLDIFEDDKLPGYQVWKRGSTSSSAMVVRIPRQMVGWKAILMDAGGFGDAAFSSAAASKKARRASKVTGKQGWEVRQEALKNSYDFRRGSGILATMHAGHRLFKHDWHIIVKDGARYMWRMDKHALALFREEDDVKVAEFRKAVPSSSPALHFGAGDGYAPDMDKRIGSFRLEGQFASTMAAEASGIFDASLALASLVAIFKARGGHRNVSACFEPSSDPLRRVLERQRQETPDREEVMLALPRPGFARDAESILSDTTDEDADHETSDTLPQRRAPPPSSRSPDNMPSRSHNHRHHHSSSAPRINEGRKRISSFFGRSNAPSGLEDQEVPAANERSMTDAQRIARQYRTQSAFLSH